MKTQEAIDMARRASEEIKSLRAQIATLRPKAEAYDCLAIILSMAEPRQLQGKSEDLAHRLDKRISELEVELKDEQSKPMSDVDL